MAQVSPSPQQADFFFAPMCRRWVVMEP